MQFRYLGLLAALALGCGSSEDSTPAPLDELDLRVQPPASDPQLVDLISPEFVIKPGEEKMYCAHVTSEQDDFSVNEMAALQGKFGHHIVLLTTTDPKPNGTIEDCTARENMNKFRSFILPDTPLPEGYGIKIPKNMQYVFQIHYVNTGDKPIRVRDVARLKKIPTEQVKVWTTTLTTNQLNLSLPPHQKGTNTTFDCVVAEDVDVLLLGGHMHEHGVRFETMIGDSVDTLQSAYLVDPWKPTFRDAPPVSLFFKNPMKLKKGSIIRTSCTWDNDQSEPVEFPAEMCSTFGYIAGTQTPLHCAPE